MVKGIIIDISLCSKRSVDEPCFVNERKLFKFVELLHPRLERLEVFNVGQVVLGEQANGGLYIVDARVQIGFDNLLAAVGKLVEEEQAHRSHGIIGGLL